LVNNAKVKYRFWGFLLNIKERIIKIEERKEGEKMLNPLILISSGREPGALSMQRKQSELYGACIELAGGIGALYTRGKSSALADRYDGLLLSGGGDIHPALYGQKRKEGLSVEIVRDAEEQALFWAFYEKQKPILGICRGIQIINVLLGGTLYQHIDGHASCCHAVECTGKLAELLGERPTVNSYHHQAINTLADGLQIAARAPDDTIEAVYMPRALGVQWHPERLVPPLCNDVDAQNHLALFEWLIRRC